MADSPDLNARALALCDELVARAAELGVRMQSNPAGTRIVDCGVQTPGSLAAGILLARICLADLAQIEVQNTKPWPQVEISTEQPVAACMASQYAGWEINGDGFFAMGSGPMRAAAAREPLFDDIGCRESPPACIGILETAQLPPEHVCRELAAKCGVATEKLSLLVARTSSTAGTLQVVARSVETALHKLHELGFDLSRIQRAIGRAPLPPVAADDLTAIGVTNDAILYGGEVMLLVSGDDASLATIGPQVPSSASRDYGKPFAEVLTSYNNNFYEIDPLLFSPAVVEFQNLGSGRSYRFGEIDLPLLETSFQRI